MRLHLKGGYDPESINIAAMVALVIIVAAAIFYLGASFNVPTHATSFYGPVNPL